VKPIKPGRLLSTLRSVLGQGSRRTEQTPAPPAEPTLADRYPLRILIAEDNLVNQKVTRQQLRRFGYDADVVANGQEALDALNRDTYDIVLMDVQMPKMDGLEATRRILDGAVDARPYIVAMTASAMEDDRRRCFDAGMDDYVTKPVDPDALADALRRCAVRKTNDTPVGQKSE
jgi:CheY-like chemotaxis protein